MTSGMAGAMRGVLAVLLAALPVGAAAEDALLARFVGDWTGDGRVVTARGADPERIRCRITNTLVEDGMALQQEGRCGVTSNTTTIEGIIRSLGDGVYEGSLQTMASRGAATLAGEAEDANRMTMTSEFVDTQTGAPAISVIEFTAEEEGYRMFTRRQDPDAEPYDEGNIVFRPRE